MFNLEFQEMQEDGALSPDFKQANPTAFTTRHDLFKTPTPTSLNFSFEAFPAPLENSMDRGLYLTNARLIQQGVLDYLRACLVEGNQVETLLQNNALFDLPRGAQTCIEEPSGLEAIVNGNQLLSPCQKKDLLRNLQEYEELTGVIVELNQFLGKQLTTEILYLFQVLLQTKGKQFQALLKKEPMEAEGLLPKMDRFWGNDQQEDCFRDAWEVYEHYDYEQIRRFSGEGVEALAMRTYFSNRLPLLTLRQCKCELKESISVVDNFATLVIHLSRNLFLNLAGMAQKQEQQQEIVNEMSFYFVEEELASPLSKKVKRQL